MQTRYQIEIRHEGLHKYRFISGPNEYVVRERADAQVAAWNEQWKKVKDRERRLTVREIQLTRKQAQAENAAAQTADAEKAIAQLHSILPTRVKNAGPLKWSALKDGSKFGESAPRKPEPELLPEPPSKNDVKFNPNLTFFDHLLSGRRKRKEQEAHMRFIEAAKNWDALRGTIEQNNSRTLVLYSANLAAWQARKDEFIAKVKRQHNQIDELEHAYLGGDARAIEEVAHETLSLADYPDCFPSVYEISFLAENTVLAIDYQLPALPQIPTLKSVKYVASRDAMEEVHLRQNELNSLYDDVIYQTALAVMNDLFCGDYKSHIKAIVFNGWVEFTNPATGQDTRSCIMSIQAERSAFEQVNLESVEAKACFRAFKGVGSSKLYSMTAVAPLVRINREDPRFIENEEIADHLNEGTNLAAIGWEDFEQLIREIFEKEFSSSGGEVKVTRASRDGGVDAVAFDPDPIRGGKIVIQAKRYTNTVEVSAVRDLYGTVMNEGATKGILVTTSTFGPDAYTFAKDKPITLMDGGNLMFLLQKHGHKAYINLAEAKKLNTEPLARTVNVGRSRG